MPASNSLNIVGEGLVTAHSNGTWSTSPVNNNCTLVGSSNNTVSYLDSSTSGFVLTSNGNSSAPSFQSIPSSLASVNSQVFTSSGTYTPTSGMKYCLVRCLGGGGAGAGCSGLVKACGGGGSGEYAEGLFSAASVGSSQVVTVGAGGIGGASNGGNGGNSSLGSLITCFGGIGALNASVFGGLGGSGGSGGYFRTPGNPGGYASLISSTLIASGNGASSPMGSGGISIGSTNSGNVGLGYGSGGSGASTVLGAVNGGSGRPGIIIIIEFS